jgi:Protein of unknown function (DUF1566)/Repeat of unknown function (DUF5648)
MSFNNIKFSACKSNSAVKQALLIGCLALLTACGSPVDDTTAVTAKTSSQSITLTNSDDSKLLASLAATYPNGQLPADLQAAASAQLAQNPAVLKLGSVQMNTAPAYYKPTATTAAVYKPVYRIQNTTLAGSYFFSIYETEGSTALDTNPGWNYEGPAFEASLTQGDGLSPVWRFRNKVNGSYLYTIYESERADLTSTYAATFEYEGVAWYGSQTAAAGLNPLFRFRNLTNGTYLFSAYETEKAAIIANFSNIFEYEGISYYVKPANAPAPFTSKLPDTGSTTCSKDVPSFSLTSIQANVDCSDPEAIAASTTQDGMTGHDVTNPLNLDGKLGFSYSNVPGYSKTDCVKDNITGLIWEGKEATGLRGNRGYTNYGDGRAGDISEYVAQVNAMALCGKTDWRVPTANELHGLIDYGVVPSAVKSTGTPTIDTKWFPNTAVEEYWSSTPASSASNSSSIPTGKLWVVSFWGGQTSAGSAMLMGTASSNYTSNRARLVSGSQPTIAARYAFSADGTEVTDLKTGLIWRRCVEGMAWNAALATCKSVDLQIDIGGSYSSKSARAHAKSLSGWRVPNIKELKSLHEGTFDRVAFPGTDISNGGFYLSSTIHAKKFDPEYISIFNGYFSRQQVWLVSFDAGWVISNSADANWLLRLVK